MWHPQWASFRDSPVVRLGAVAPWPWCRNSTRSPVPRSRIIENQTDPLPDVNRDLWCRDLCYVSIPPYAGRHQGRQDGASGAKPKNRGTKRGRSEPYAYASIGSVRSIQRNLGAVLDRESMESLAAASDVGSERIDPLRSRI